MKRTLFSLLILFSCLMGKSSFASEPDVDEIVAKAENIAYYAGKDGRADVKMTITDRQGRKRFREFTIFRLDMQDGGEQKFYVYFKKPEDIRGMVYMVWKRLNRDDDRWLYLPALDLVRRIAASDKRSSFVGSNFAYEDISGRSIEEDTHELIEQTKEYYKLKNVPRDQTSVEFAYYDIWIDKDTFMPFKAEYYDNRDKLYKVIEALKVEEVQGYSTVVRSKASDLNSGNSTIIEFANVEYDIGLTEDIFTERYLRKLPRKWIK